MGYGIETVVGGYTAAATATVQAFTANSAQSFNVRALAPGSMASIRQIWTQSSAAGQTRIRSPRLHDDVVGLAVDHLANNVSPLTGETLDQPIYSQDTLIVEDNWVVAPAAVAQGIGFQVYYDDVPGISANFDTWANIAPKVQSYYGVYVTASSAAAPQNWGAGVAINNSQDNFKANSWYALLGYITNVRFTALSVLGTDLGNLYVGGPGSVDPLVTRNYFYNLERITGKPSIPIINSQNKGATLVQIADNVASTAYTVGLLFAYLGPTGA